MFIFCCHYITSAIQTMLIWLSVFNELFIGGVRSFFKERRSKQSDPSSAGPVRSYQTKKKEGYDKSRPLQPINNYNTQRLGTVPMRGASDPTLTHSSKVSLSCSQFVLSAPLYFMKRILGLCIHICIIEYCCDSKRNG